MKGRWSWSSTTRRTSAATTASDILGTSAAGSTPPATGATALEMVRQTPCDVALLDLRMPGMNGLELCQAIKSVRQGTVIDPGHRLRRGLRGRAADLGGASRSSRNP
ncbi:MAG: response regulator [Isosphaeraceae bacterium]